MEKLTDDVYTYEVITEARTEGPYLLMAGAEVWRKNGLLHRDGDQPAYMSNIARAWFVNGVRHRDGDQPAYVSRTTSAWFVNGVRHRDGDLPAIEDVWGDRQWYKNGKLHRDGDLPAIEGGTKYWSVNGVLHREDGPAVVRSDGTTQYFLNGVEVTSSN